MIGGRAEDYGVKLLFAFLAAAGAFLLLSTILVVDIVLVRGELRELSRECSDVRTRLEVVEKVTAPAALATRTEVLYALLELYESRPKKED